MNALWQQARARHLSKRLYIWAAEDSLVIPVGRPEKGKKRVSVLRRLTDNDGARTVFLRGSTKSMANLPSWGYYFEGAEYVFVDSKAKARYSRRTTDLNSCPLRFETDIFASQRPHSSASQRDIRVYC